MRKHPLYSTWRNMIYRCTNPKCGWFRWYGARGVTVCDRWKTSLAAFVEDMGPKPSPNMTLDRVNNSKGYEPGNCRWATAKEQSENRDTPFRRKSFCKNGHKLSGENLKVHKTGYRACRECIRQNSRRYSAKKRATAQDQQIGDGTNRL